MIAKVSYDSIKQLRPGELVEHLNGLHKWPVTEARVIDLLNEEALKKPITEAYFKELSPRGVYLFFREQDMVNYIGQTNQSFYQRILTQLDTTYYPGFGWNSMLVIMGCKRLKKMPGELTEEDHEYDFEEVCKLKLLIIDVPDNVSSLELRILERVLQKAYREHQDENTLLNSRVGWLHALQREMTIHQLIK